VYRRSPSLDSRTAHDAQTLLSIPILYKFSKTIVAASSHVQNQHPHEKQSATRWGTTGATTVPTPSKSRRSLLLGESLKCPLYLYSCLT
jgi:hypothetical protein